MANPLYFGMLSDLMVNTERWCNGEVSMYSHLNERKLSYCEHFVESLRHAKTFCVLSLKAVGHAILPCIYTTSSSDFIESCRRNEDGNLIYNQQDIFSNTDSMTEMEEFVSDDDDDATVPSNPLRLRRRNSANESLNREHD